MCQSPLELHFYLHLTPTGNGTLHKRALRCVIEILICLIEAIRHPIFCSMHNERRRLNMVIRLYDITIYTRTTMQRKCTNYLSIAYAPASSRAAVAISAPPGATTTTAIIITGPPARPPAPPPPPPPRRRRRRHARGDFAWGDATLPRGAIPGTV